ncbi:type I phosphomannose isomerase catalytic subunit [Oscillospiraceae bacterium PP1C4]
MNHADEKTLACQPIFFERNRVMRVYDGGKLFADFFGDEPVDSKFPEEWVASTVKALNWDSSDPNEGLSVVRGTQITLKQLIEHYPAELLGEKTSFDLLVKLLDSAIRLPIQAHPDKAFSRQYFNSDYGKTEMWVLLATRENASIYFGFKNKITRSEFEQAIEASKSDKNAMTPLLNRIAVKPGDVFLIPAKAVHAIGYGCLILEVQEPTDFTIQPEHWCGNYALSDSEMYMGLPKEIAIDCFDFSICGDGCADFARKLPKVVVKNESLQKESLVSYEDTPCFAANRYQITYGSIVLQDAPAIYIVTEGNGCIEGKDYQHDIKKGDTFFMPHAARGNFSLTSQTGLQLVECLPAQA